ncbi:hypothetical protein CTA2_2301 [Colletotrichum tanaceti]|nr:hypothetical protein CTA2_2301 [Colletotrichum tanaceti]
MSVIAIFTSQFPSPPPPSQLPLSRHPSALFGTYLVLPTVSEASSWLTRETQEIAPVYYDLDSFEKGDVKTALTRAAEKKRRKEAMKNGR